ncbi:hypothetical protein HPB48_016085 [Haemaphysalis longicornis]|uniref:Protein MMS22-like n=1 Tax=Haemaphysalis longicornis TaxID=44386 RepID=A0A9J6GYC1_HAELO|nr:hypothetical protein HPB48_016085 [Haemaphysalis longicornis]
MFDCTDRAVRVGASACNFSPDVPYVRLCGQLLCRDRLTHAQLTRLFWSARSKFMTLDVSQSFRRSTEAYKQHHEVSCLLAYIRHEVDRLADTGASRDGLDSFGRETADSMGPHDFCRCVVDELRQTLRMVGPCSGLPVADWNHCDSGDGHRFHLALEVWWTALHVVDVAMSFNLLRAGVERTERDSFCLWLLAAAAEARKNCVWGAKKERLMRVVVRSCIRLCGLWEPSLELVQPLLDFYLKHLDESFMIASCHFQAFQAACQTSQQIQVRALALAECDDLGVSICSRFHANRVEELTEVGLRNCSLLFLVLSLSIRQHPEEPVDRLLSVLALVPADSPVEKLQAALRSLFAVLLLLQTTSADLSTAAQKTAAWFFERCVSSKRSAKSHRLALSHPLWCSGLAPQGGSQCQSLRTALLPVYTQGIRDVVDASSNLALSEQALLAFSGAICRSSLQFLHKALALPVHAPAPQACFTDLAVSITLLALDLPPPQSGQVKASFVSLFDHFGCSPHTHPSASGRFLCLLLEDDQVSSELETRAANAEARIVQSWLRCCVAVEPPCAEMTRLSRIILSRKEFERYNALVGAVVPSKDDDLLTHDELAVHFLDCLAQYADIVSAMDGLSALSQLRQSVAFYLRDFASLVVAQLRSGTATSTRLANVYFLCGQLFRLCAGLLYTRGMADCLLPKLLDSLVLPSALYAGKLIPQAQLAAIKQHLPLFVCGLLILSPQSDAYIERKLKDIVVHYLPMFPTVGQASQLDTAKPVAKAEATCFLELKPICCGKPSLCPAQISRVEPMAKARTDGFPKPMAAKKLSFLCV